MADTAVGTDEVVQGGVGMGDGDIGEEAVARFLSGPEQQRNVHHAVDDGKAAAVGKEVVPAQLVVDVVGDAVIHSAPCPDISAVRHKAVCQHLGRPHRQRAHPFVAGKAVSHRAVQGVHEA